MSQLLVEASIFQEDSIVPDGPRLKIRKLIISDDRKFWKAWGLSFETGEWVEVKEGAQYPDECITIVKR